MPNVYQGPNSWYARKEGIYVKRIEKPGIDTIPEAAAILALILRDYRRGWTYDRRTGRIVRMTKKLFTRRSKYVLTLSKNHGATVYERKIIANLINHVLTHKSLPKRYRKLAKKMIVRVS